MVSYFVTNTGLTTSYICCD